MGFHCISNIPCESSYIKYSQIFLELRLYFALIAWIKIWKYHRKFLCVINPPINNNIELTYKLNHYVSYVWVTNRYPDVTHSRNVSSPSSTRIRLYFSCKANIRIFHDNTRFHTMSEIWSLELTQKVFVLGKRDFHQMPTVNSTEVVMFEHHPRNKSARARFRANGCQRWPSI